MVTFEHNGGGNVVMFWPGGTWVSSEVTRAGDVAEAMAVGACEGYLAMSPSGGLCYGPAELLWFDPARREGDGLEVELRPRAIRTAGRTGLGVMPISWTNSYGVFWAEVDDVTLRGLDSFPSREAALEVRDGLCSALRSADRPFEMVEQVGGLYLRLAPSVGGSWVDHFADRYVKGTTRVDNVFPALRGLARCTGVFHIRATFVDLSGAPAPESVRSRYVREVEFV